MTAADRRLAAVAAALAGPRAPSILGRLGEPGRAGIVVLAERLAAAPRAERLRALAAELAPDPRALRDRAALAALAERGPVARVLAALPAGAEQGPGGSILVRLCRERLSP